MKIVMIGGSGLIGTKLGSNLRALGHEAVSASPRSGVNAVTGEGLAEVLVGADVVVDVSNSPSFADQDVLEFFEKSTRNLLAAEEVAGVKHHVAVSVVGADRNPESGYLRAKVAQENLIKGGKIPYTILRATQFFEFVEGIAGASTVGNEVRLPSNLMQPVASDDVAAAVTDIVIGAPLNETVELAGPDAIRLDELVRQFLQSKQDPRVVTTDAGARYFGAKVDDRSLTPGGVPRLGSIHFKQWLSEVNA